MNKNVATGRSKKIIIIIINSHPSNKCTIAQKLDTFFSQKWRHYLITVSKILKFYLRVYITVYNDFFLRKIDN